MELNGAILFMGLCLFSPMLFSICISAIEKLERPKVITKEVIKVEYVDRVVIKEIQTEVKTEKSQPVPAIQKIEKESPIKQECLECLISLGMKKRVAKDKVEKMWASKNYNSIESFLIDAYRV